MEFYKDCFGGELQFMTVKDGPMAAEVPEESHGLIMHSTLRNNGWTLVGSDMMRDRATAGDQVGIMVDFKNESEMRAVFDKLAVGGEVFMPVEDAFWGAFFGVLTDKYGVEWSLNCTKA